MTSLVDDSSARSVNAEPTTWADQNLRVVSLGVTWVRVLLQAYLSSLEHQRAGDRPAAFADDADVVSARRAYESGRAAMRDRREPATIDRLSLTFGLAPFDEDVLLLAIAARLDPAIRAMYRSAHDHARLESPTPNLAMTLLAGAATARPEAYARFGPAAPLRRFALIAVDESGTDAFTTIDVDERLMAYVLGRDEIDARVRAYLRGVTAGPCPARHEGAVTALVSALGNRRPPAALVLGPRACGHRAVAAEGARRIGMSLVNLDVSALPPEPSARRARLMLVARESLLSRLALLVDLSGPRRASGEDAPRQGRDVVDDALATLETVVLVIADDQPSLDASVPVVRLEALESGDRAEVWRTMLGERAHGVQVDDLAEQFALDPGEIAAIAATSGAGDTGALWARARDAAAHALTGLVDRVEPRFGWDDLIVPPAVRDDLRALVAQVRYRRTVYHDWGFAERLPRGRGVTALLAGPTGVGKTMAAEVIARDLRLDLYRIDLSGVVSKYIGETEKNLRRVFDAAEAGGAVLFFDEADALFGKRSEVRDSHDRYANIEVSYLLQRMEAYSGLAILATNLKSHIDASFLRRLRYVIDIPFPDAALRRAIWMRAFPAGAPRDDLDFTALARLDIAGGNIVVIAVNAAFLAAAEHAPIGMRHVARAARAEFRKLDKEFRTPWPDTTTP